MIPDIHQSIDQVLKSASPEQKILWSQIRLLVGENAAISPYFFIGAPIIEHSTYSANRLYLIYDFCATQVGAENVNNGQIVCYDNLNNPTLRLNKISMAWNTTAAAMRYSNYTINAVNFYTSYFLFSIYDAIKIIGYKITY